MATRSLGSLTLDLIAKIGGFQQSMDRAARAAAQATKKIEDDAKRRAEGVTRAFRGISAAIGAIGLAGIARELVQLGDTYQQLSARISLVTNNQTQLDTALQSTFAIAQETRQSFEQTGQLYVRLAQATQDLGRSQAETLDVTKAINQSIIISGTSAAGASAALIQLGQGFASGVLRGEELNSVLEQAPRLARAIADGLGVSIGELRALGKEGALTSEVVFDAILKSQAKLSEEFKKLPPTVDQALTQVGNSVLRLVGQINQATGATPAIAAVIAGFANSIDSALDSFSSNEVIRAQTEVDNLATRLIIALQTKSPENPAVKLLQRQLDQARETLKLLKAEIPGDQTGAETSRLGRQNGGLRDGNAAGRALSIDTSTLTGLREQLKSLTALRDSAKVGTAEFAKYNTQIKALEANIKSLSGGRPTGGGGGRSDPAKQLLESLQDQLQKTEDLTVAESTLRELQKAEYAKVSPLRKQEILEAAKLIDLAKEREEQEKKAGEVTQAVLEARRQVAIDELEAINKTNGAYQDLIQSLIDATPTAQLEKQRETVQALSDEYLRGRFGIVGSQEAVAAYGETVNEFLGNVGDKLKETKGIGEELGLTFTSAFEDAIVGGKGLLDILGSLEKDIVRIITRKLVTEPLGDFFSGFAKDLFGGSGGSGGGGGGGAGILDSLFSFLPSFDVGTNYVPRDMLAMVHQGEEIVPAALNKSGAASGMTVVQNFSVSGSMDKRTQLQIAAEAQRGLQAAARNL